ncbi:hypothetical protein [Agromyces subbeticus]|uniref:hypothetical protein n=1 Tax=Agromyces subbeticus TaxID=293890 RepID=UPI0012EBF074|nr:hypothetical protein [Agromyces subbeticus]
MAPVIEVTSEALRMRRSEILERLETNEEMFWAAVACRSLSAEEWEAKEELSEIAFLLGEDSGH